MNGSMGNNNMAFGAPEQPGTPETIMSLKNVHKMLPLVQHIVQDILNSHQNLERLQPEQDRLERQKRDLAWPERQRRYQLQEELRQAENKLNAALEELTELGVFLLDINVGRVGFPTLVNNRRAFFSWKMGDESLRYWHFAEETNVRPIPSAWLKEIGGVASSI